MSTTSSVAPNAIFTGYGRTGLLICEKYDSTRPAQTSMTETPPISVIRSPPTSRRRVLSVERPWPPISALATINPAWPAMMVAGSSMTPCGISQPSTNGVSCARMKSSATAPRITPL